MSRAVGATPARRPRARRGEGERLRHEILEAAEALLLETGDEDRVSVRAIADRAGVTSPSIYLHFPDKESLFFEVCNCQFARFHEVIERAAAGVSDPIEALQRRGAAYVRFGLEHPEAYRIMFMQRSPSADAQTGAIEKAGIVAFESLVAAVQRAIEAGALPAELDPQAAARFIWTGVHGLTSLLIALPTFPWGDRDDLIAGTCSQLLRALR